MVISVAVCRSMSSLGRQVMLQQPELQVCTVFMGARENETQSWNISRRFTVALQTRRADLGMLSFHFQSRLLNSQEPEAVLNTCRW